MRVEIRTRLLKNGNQSLYLDFYDKGKRWYEYMNLYLVPEVDDLTKQQNRKTMERAVSIRAKRILGEERQPEADNHAGDIYVLDWLNGYLRRLRANPSTSAARIWRCMNVLRLTTQYVRCIHKPKMKMSELDRNFCLGFIEHLRNSYCYRRVAKRKKLSQSTAYGYQNGLCAMFYQAVREGVIDSNPFTQLSRQELVHKPATSRGFLTVDEMNSLAKAETDMPNVKAAFMFCCFTGLRWSDMKQLRWGDIQRSDIGPIVNLKEMKKTKRPIVVPLGENAMNWMPPRDGKSDDDNVFTVPTLNCCNVKLKAMAKSVGIDKRVSFHLSRHTAATLIFAATKDLYTVSKLLGHTSVDTTHVYASVTMDDKVTAVNKLHELMRDVPSVPVECSEVKMKEMADKAEAVGKLNKLFQNNSI